MKRIRLLRTGIRPARLRAFTLTEVMISMTIIVMVFTGILTTHVFGLRLYDLTRAKLGASDDARASLGKIALDIRSAKLVRIGTGTSNDFTECAINAPQIGNAIQLYASTNTNFFVRYYLDPADNHLKRTTNNMGVTTVIAHSISNYNVFTAESYAGSILTNNENNRVIGLKLQFVQLFNPSLPIGPGNYFDHYQLSTKITRRTLE